MADPDAPVARNAQATDAATCFVTLTGLDKIIVNAELRKGGVDGAVLFRADELSVSSQGTIGGPNTRVTGPAVTGNGKPAGTFEITVGASGSNELDGRPLSCKVGNVQGQVELADNVQRRLYQPLPPAPPGMKS